MLSVLSRNTSSSTRPPTMGDSTSSSVRENGLLSRLGKLTRLVNFDDSVNPSCYQPTDLFYHPVIHYIVISCFDGIWFIRPENVDLLNKMSMTNTTTITNRYNYLNYTHFKLDKNNPNYQLHPLLNYSSSILVTNNTDCSRGKTILMNPENYMIYVSCR